MKFPGSASIVLMLADGGSADGWIQPFAGGQIWTEQPLAAGARRARRPVFDSGDLAPQGDWSLSYDGPGLVDGGLHPLRADLSAGGERRVSFADGEEFLVDAQGVLVRRLGPGVADARSLERALGAPTALALAVSGIYLLHASAAMRTGEGGGSGAVTAFTANSGAGKSTLAAATCAGASGWLRVADDQLPVELTPSASALPHFPQLKLAPGESYPASAVARLPLAQLVEIEHSRDYREFELERLDPAAGCLTLVRATVAAKLFDQNLLAAHFESCAAASQRLPIFRLRFPTGLAHLPEVLAAVGAAAESLRD